MGQAIALDWEGGIEGWELSYFRDHRSFEGIYVI